LVAGSSGHLASTFSGAEALQSAWLLRERESGRQRNAIVTTCLKASTKRIHWGAPQLLCLVMS